MPNIAAKMAATRQKDNLKAQARKNIRLLTYGNSRPDRFTIIVVTLLSIVTISTTSVLLYGVPRMTLLSIPFTIYMFLASRSKINPVMVRFGFAYFLAFVPAAIGAYYKDDIKWVSFLQGSLGLVTLCVAATYFYSWLFYAPMKTRVRHFQYLAIFFLLAILIELLAPKIFSGFRGYLYDSGGFYLETNIEREARLYGTRPAFLFSEPSNFARYIGIMMTAYLASTFISVGSRWSFGLAMLGVRSVSYFVALPALIYEARRVVSARGPAQRASRKRQPLGRIVAIMIAVGLIAAGIAYTQSARISAALSGGPSASAAVSGDTSLNERILVPIGFLYDEGRSVVGGLGPTPQDDLNDYAISRTRAIYRFQKSYEDRTAIAASINVIAGMGLIGIVIFCLLAYFWIGVFGLELVVAFFIINFFSSGYNSTISLVPTALIFSILMFQRSQTVISNAALDSVRKR